MTIAPRPNRLDPEFPGLLPALLLADPASDQAPRRVRRSPRDWFVDVLCFLIAMSMGFFTFAETIEAEGDSVTVLQFLDLLVGIAGCLALWLRRRWPVGLAVALTLASAFSGWAGVASVVALFTVAVHRRFAVTAAIAVASILVSFVYYEIYPEQGLSWAATAAISILGVVAVTAWGMFVRARRQLVLSLRERARQAESEAALRVGQARHLERERIAREMHDVLAHRLSLLSVHAGALEYRKDAPAEDVARAAGVVRDSAHQALQDLREVIGVLRAPDSGLAAGSPAEADRPQPSLTDLPALATESRGAGMRLTLEDRRADAHPVPPVIDRCAYRVVQEGLTNARKHAGRAAVTVIVEGEPGAGLTVEVRNRAPVGSSVTAPIPGTGTGLIGLAERVDLAGGRLAHGREPDGDYRLSAWLPWPL